MGIDTITEVNKNIDEIEHIEKFNPFHDSRGRFSNSHGMSSYSANPKTKAGQMAIARSTAAGYGAVMNVHRESKGENIRQNDQWVRSGQKPNKSQLARAQANAPKNVAQARLNAHTNRVKGTMGATETAQAKHPQNARRAAVNAARAQAAQNASAKQTQQAPQKPQQNQQAQQNVQTKNVQQTMQSKVFMNVDFDQSTVAGAVNKEFRGTAHGKDLTKNLDFRNSIASDSYGGQDRFTDKVCDQQGFNSPAKKVSKAEFDKLAKQHGDVFQREVDGSPDLNGRRVTAKGMKDAYTTENDMKLNGGGGRVYGDGLYVASGAMRAHNTRGYKDSDFNDPTIQKQVRNAIQFYGDGQTVLKMTWNAKPNIVNQGQVQQEWNKLSRTERAKFGNHMNTYAAAKGYDAMRTQGTTDYMVIFNRSKIAVLDD